MIKKEEQVSFYTHFIAGLISVAGTVVLLIKTAGNFNLSLIAFIYGLSITSLFGASAVYHAKKKEENDKSVWRKLDHTAIFIMIAGTYTPIAYLYLTDGWFIGIISAQWALVIFGLIFKFVFIKAPRILYTSIYLAMGWMAVIPLKNLAISMPYSQIVLLFSGGFAFTVGAVFYALKWPVFKKGIFGFHEVFHVMTLIGAGFHYAVVYRGF